MKLKKVLDGKGEIYGFAFECPGCQGLHIIPTSGRVVWKFNGNMERPTFTPSLKNTRPKDVDLRLRCCHLNLTDGKLHFHSDSTHDLAGTVCDLPELKENLCSD